MPTNLTSVLQRLHAHRRLVLAVHVVLVALAIAGLPRLGVDNSPRVFFVDDATEVLRYREFQHLFGRDQVLRIVLEGDGLWTPEGLEFARSVEDRLAGLHGVLGGAGLYAHHRWRFPDWPPDAQHLRAAAVRDPLDLAAGWVSADGRMATILAVLFDLDAKGLEAATKSVENLVNSPPPDVAATVVGLPVLARALDRAALDVGRQILPWLVVLSLILLIVVLQDLRSVLVALTYVGTSLVILLGGMGWMRVDFSMVSSILVPLVFVMTLATAIYLLVEFRHQVSRDRPAEPAEPGRLGRSESEVGALRSGDDATTRAVEATYDARGWSVVWTGLTTFAGFGSLAVSRSPPVQDLGVWTAVGIALLVIEAFFLYPLLLTSVVGSRPRTPRGVLLAARWERATRILGRRIATLAIDHQRLVLTLFTIAVLASVLGSLRLRVGEGLLDYFRSDDPTRVEVERIQAEGIGLVAFELVITPDDEDLAPGDEVSAPLDFVEASTLDRLSSLATDLRRDDLVLNVLSLNELVGAAGRIDRRTCLGEESDEACTPLAFLSSNGETEPLLRSLLSRDHEATRLTVSIPVDSMTSLEPLFESALARTREAFPGSRVWLTGVYPLVVQGQRTILRTMVSTLIITLLVVATIFAFLVRSVRSLVFVLVPNLWPVLFVLGLMGALGVPIDGTTVMIASVVLGLAVDDTLHTLGALRRLAPRLGARAGAISAIEETAAGHLLTTMVLAGGFALCGLSGFIPIARFGTLVASALCLALLADLFLVPVLLSRLSGGDLDRLARAQRPGA